MFEIASPLSLASLGTIVLAVSVLLYLLRRVLLPKPIPGIPFNKNAAKSIWGDAPSLMKYNSETREIWGWLLDQLHHHKSPVVQVFARPFGRPWILINDFQESQDILMRRTKELDRSEFFGDIFVGTIPAHHISKRSSDPHFKRNRALLKDLMTPAFLHDVAAPSIYTTIESLLELWTRKMEFGQGHPFAADEDIYRAALDAIFSAAFPLDAKEGNTAAQSSFLASNPPAVIPSDPDSPVEFTQAETPRTFESIITLTDAIEVAIKAPFPRLAHAVLRLFPWYRQANRAKELLIEEQIQAGVKRFQNHEETYKQTCALDEIIHREYNLAKKEERKPDYHSRVIKDEIFGFLIGGHDTTSTMVAWAFKFLSDHPQVQDKLRQHLRTHLPTAAAEQRNPSASEIATSHLPYLEAVMEENLRLAKGISGIVRVTVEDSVVLGHFIPKGYDLVMFSSGPGFIQPLEPHMVINDDVRSTSSRKGRQVGVWDNESIGEFIPERWITTDEKGEESFDATAGPMLSFGLGPRGCFGRRLAYVEMRQMIALVIWNFELLKCSEELSSYKGVDKLLHKPEHCYLKLKPAVR